MPSFAARSKIDDLLDFYPQADPEVVAVGSAK